MVRRASTCMAGSSGGDHDHGDHGPLPRRIRIALIPGALPAELNAPLFNLLLNAFVIVHALTLYRVWDVVAFYVVTLVVSFSLENIGVLSGFPFGSYYYSDALGPKLGEVPILIGFSYVGAAYASWWWRLSCCASGHHHCAVR